MKGNARKVETLIEPSLKDSELRYRRLFETAQDGILILNARTGMVEDVNPYLIKMLGYSRAEFIKKKLWEVGAFKDIEASKEAFEALQEKEFIRYEDLPLKTKNGRLIQVEFVSNVYLVGDKKVIQCQIRDITEHRRIIAALQENEKKYHDLVNQSPDGVFIMELSGNILTVNKAMSQELEYSEEEFLSMSIWDIIPEQYLDQYRKRLTKILAGESLEEAAEYKVRGKDGRIHYVEVLSAPRYSGEDIIGFQGIARDVTARKQAAEALQESERRFQLASWATKDVVWERNFSTHTISWNDSLQKLFHYPADEIKPTVDWWQDHIHPAERIKVINSIQAAIDQGEDFWSKEYRFRLVDGSYADIFDRGYILYDEQGKPLQMIGAMVDITEQKRAEERIQRQFEHLTALSTIDRFIAASFDLKLSLSEILTHVTIELGIDAADILILNSDSQMLEYGAERGFHNKANRNAQVRLGESYAGRAALERQLIHIPNLRDEPDNLFSTTFLTGEDFVCYYGVPLIAKGQVKGVLEVFHRAALEPDAEWLEFLNALAGQAAIAIDNLTLFDDLQRSNSELMLAYETTLEGWSHALDLRDKETEGHTQRVADMTVKLARAFGLSEAELVNVRRGALLHDIGKMGVPDNILLKPSELTKVEWEQMRMHPVYAYDMLSHIAYLHEALEIPYCHHEKWDGTGYPRGLKGAQIPLVARIFAVVDVWDAINSDRPYRLAWTKEKAREHIRSLSGTHFDPQVVEVFMQTPNQI